MTAVDVVSSRRASGGAATRRDSARRPDPRFALRSEALRPEARDDRTHYPGLMIRQCELANRPRGFEETTGAADSDDRRRVRPRGIAVGVRVTRARIRPPRLGTVSRSSRWIRQSFSWFTTMPSRLTLLRNADDLRFAVPALSHRPSLVDGFQRGTGTFSGARSLGAGSPKSDRLISCASNHDA